MGLVEWLGSLIQYRANPPARGAARPSNRLRGSLRHGVTTIGEIAQPGGSHDAYLASPCDGTIFLELIAPRVERVQPPWKQPKTMSMKSVPGNRA